MKLLLTEGLVLNVVTMPAPRSAAEAAIAGMVRTALAGDDPRRGGAAVPQHGIRVNAIGPRADAPEAGACLASEPDIAALRRCTSPQSAGAR